MTGPATSPETNPETDAVLPTYDRADIELFDLDAFAHVSDQRSIGELLFDVDRHARLLLMDVCEYDAAALLHAWPKLISAAGSMWHAMPEPLPEPLPTPAADLDRAGCPASCMDRLDVISV